MAEKKSWVDTFKESFSTVSDVLFSTVFSRVNAEADVLMNKVESRALILEEEMIRKLIIAGLLGVGVLLVLGAIMFYLVDIIGAERWIVLLGFGILVLIVGMYMKIQDLSRRKA